MNKKIVILANSRKLSGRCVAGKDEYGVWVRLTKRNDGPIPVMEARNFNMLEILEVSDVVNKPSREFKYHTENSIYTRTSSIGNLDMSILDSWVDNPTDIFGNGKYVSELEAQQLEESLIFVKVTNFIIYLKDGGQYADTLRGQFNYNGRSYTDISMTDSFVEARLANCRSQYQETHAQAYITISLGVIFKGYAYKLISGVIIP